MFFLSFICIRFLCLFNAPPGEQYQKIASIPTEAYYLSTDNLGNVYTISQAHDLNKYKNDGSFVSTQNIKVNGPISSMDVSNTLQLNLFYRNLNKVVILDNLLAFRGDILLDKLGITQAAAAARAFDNGLWVFDLGDLQLKKIDKELKSVVLQSGNVRMFSDKKKSINPVFIFDNVDRVYVNNPSTGIMVFDAFAQYIKTFPVTGLRHFQVLGDELVYFQNNTLFTLPLKTGIARPHSLPDSSELLDVRLEKNRLYLLKKNELTLYAF